MSIALSNSKTLFVALLGFFLKGFLWTNTFGGNMHVYLVKTGKIFSRERWKWVFWAHVASRWLPGAAAADRGGFRPRETPAFISQTDITLQSLAFGHRSTLEGQKEALKASLFFCYSNNLYSFKGLTRIAVRNTHDFSFCCETVKYIIYLAIYLLLLLSVIICGSLFKVHFCSFQSLTAPGHTLFIIYCTLLQHLYS